MLDLVVYDHDFAGKDDFMGRASIDLAAFEPERTHNVEQVGEEEGQGRKFWGAAFAYRRVYCPG